MRKTSTARGDRGGGSTFCGLQAQNVERAGDRRGRSTLCGLQRKTSTARAIGAVVRRSAPYRSRTSTAKPGRRGFRRLRVQNVDFVRLRAVGSTFCTA
jgi:hypothetical protein